MKLSIGKTISKSIKENKWLNIKYINKNKEESSFWCAIIDIIIEKKSFKVEIFNVFKGIDAKSGSIYFNSITEAKVVEGTYYEVNQELIKKIELNIDKLEWLEFDNFNDKILEYYAEAKKLDVDPYQKEYAKVSGIDTRVMLEKKSITLNDNQLKTIAEDIYNNQIDDKKTKYFELAINKLSIFDNGKEYVVAYYPLSLNVKTKELVIKDKLVINKSSLIQETKVSLASYLDISIDDFVTLIHSNFDEAKELLRNNLRSNEKLDENPLIMLINRDFNIEYEKVYEYIIKKHKDGELELPLKAFFGEMSKRNKGRTEPNIVLINKKVDIDQVRVVYNAMKNPVTYVQGPPGTGKTTTILNVVLSVFLNNQSCLICSNNNYPIDGIIKKLTFDCKYGKIPFPAIRLGNRDEIKKSIDYIKKLIAEDKNVNIFDDKLKQLTDSTASSYNELKTLLSIYEEKKELLSTKEYLDRFYDFVMQNKESSLKLKNKLTEQKEKLETKMSSLRDVLNEDILKNIVSAKDNPNYMMYLFFNSYKYIKKLNQATYKNLIDIINIDDEEKKVTEFIKYLKDDTNFKKFQKVFPIIVCTNTSCLKLGTNNTYFDLCIMDEAGQCDVATSLIPISKARRLLLVGDVNQLQPVITLDDAINDTLMDRFEVPKEYDYCHNSIINLMTCVDEISPKILLSYHYRCGHKIADYSNKRYYDNKLNIKTTLEGNQLTYINVHNDRFYSERNSYLAEAYEVVNYIKTNHLDETNVSIITPFRNQAYLINEILKKENIKVKCGTIHTVQGAENKNIIFSPAIGIKSSKKTYDWLANNKELLNVAVTRAQNKFIMIADEEALNAYANNTIEDDIIALKNYIKANGDVEIAKSTVNTIEIGLSNGSECEKELFGTLTHFCSVYKRFTVKRNQPVRKILNDISNDDLNNYFNKAEFDLVLFSKNIYGKINARCVIELNGGEHYISKSKSEINDKKKMQICKMKGLTYLSLPNAYSKSYETISNLIFAMNGEDDLEEYNLFNCESQN